MPEPPEPFVSITAEEAANVTGDCSLVATDGGAYVMDYRFDYKADPVNFAEGIVFSVAARRDAHIVLSPTNAIVGSQRGHEMYEIVIGGWGNTQSRIRRGSAVHTSDSKFRLRVSASSTTFGNELPLSPERSSGIANARCRSASPPRSINDLRSEPASPSATLASASSIFLTR